MCVCACVCVCVLLTTSCNVLKETFLERYFF